MPVRKSLLASLWLLANQESFRGVADRFDFDKGHLHRIFLKICSSLSANVSKYIKWPFGPSALENVNGFNNLRGLNSFPGVIGCVDGTHIQIPGPIADDSYYTRKGIHAVQLQAVCNYKMEFIDIFCGWPGSAHDARVWSNSPLGMALEKGDLILPKNTYILGDSAYPLTSYLMVPFRDNGHLTNRQKRFNQKLSSTRVVIENALGRLKGMFRRLKYLYVVNLKHIKDIIVTTCILHNLCIENGDVESYETENNAENDSINNNVTAEGNNVRNALLESLEL